MFKFFAIWSVTFWITAKTFRLGVRRKKLFKTDENVLELNPN